MFPKVLLRRNRQLKLRLVIVCYDRCADDWGGMGPGGDEGDVGKPGGFPGYAMQSAALQASGHQGVHAVADPEGSLAEIDLLARTIKLDEVGHANELVCSTRAINLVHFGDKGGIAWC